MPPYKPMKLRDYKRWIAQFGWYLEKGSVDWTLKSEQGKVLAPNIIVSHPGNEVVPPSVKKTEKLLKTKGLI